MGSHLMQHKIHDSICIKEYEDEYDCLGVNITFVPFLAALFVWNRTRIQPCGFCVYKFAQISHEIRLEYQISCSYQSFRQLLSVQLIPRYFSDIELG